MKLLNPLENFITDPRKQLGSWIKRPPVALSWIIFGLVVLELTVAKNIYHGTGFGRLFVQHLLSYAVIILFLEYAIGKSGTLMANIFLGEKAKSRPQKTLFSIFNLGLIPMLLFLPITVVIMATGGFHGVRLILFFFLVYKVFSFWRVSLEKTFSLSPFQSGLAVSGALSSLFLLLVFLMYANAIVSVSKLLSS